MEPLFSGLRKILVAWVGHGISDRHRFHLLNDQPREAFLNTHADLADRGPIKTGGCPEGEPLVFRIKQVERADIGARPFGDGLRDILQSFL